MVMAVLTLVYTAGSFGRDDLVREDKLQLFVDANGDGVRQAGEPFAELDALEFVRPADLVALGDSYSAAGENGEYRAHWRVRSRASTGSTISPRERASIVIAGTRRMRGCCPACSPTRYSDVETYACTGAISLNIFNPADAQL